MTKTTYALVMHYSFDHETSIWLFNSPEKASTELKKQFEEEVRIETEENGHVIGEDMEINTSEDWKWASITIYWDENKDVTEWSIGYVRN